MNGNDCGTTRARLPDLARHGPADGTLAAAAAHVVTCSDCAAELALVRLLHGSRPEPRPELPLRIERTLRFEREAVRRPWWGLTAAALAALALGIGFSSGPGGETVAPAFALETGEGWIWETADGLVAGGVVLDELSDDALEHLLEDLADDAGRE